MDRPAQPPRDVRMRGFARRTTVKAALAWVDEHSGRLPAEQVETDGDRLCALAELPPGKNVAQRGEDVAAGSVVLKAGRILRPQDLGLLSSIGRAEIEIVRQPRVSLVISGNELLPAGS